MNLFILRHGPAREPSDWAPRTDDLRPLTSSGEVRVKDVAKAMRRMDLSFDVILTSPYERALKTAKIVAKVLDQKRDLLECPSLVPGGDQNELMEQLAEKEHEWENVLLVGHEPSLSQLIARLTTGQFSGYIEMKKAGLAKLRVSKPVWGPCATLEFLLPPKLIS